MTQIYRPDWATDDLDASRTVKEPTPEQIRRAAFWLWGWGNASAESTERFAAMYDGDADPTHREFAKDRATQFLRYVFNGDA